MLLAAEAAGEHLLMGDHAADGNGVVRLRALAAAGATSLELIVDGCQVAALPGDALDLELDLGAGRHFIYVRAKRSIDGEVLVSWTSPLFIGPPR